MALLLVVMAVAVLLLVKERSSPTPPAGSPIRNEATAAASRWSRPASVTRQPLPEPGPRVTVPAPLSGTLPHASPLYVSAGAEPSGRGSPERPFRTIQEALTRARPGDTVVVREGTYRGPVKTVRSGRPDAPIRVVAAGEARIRGNGDGRLVQVLHDHVTIEGFDISGADILVWVFQAQGVRLLGNTLHEARGECVRLRYFARDNEVAGNRIEGCGREGFDLSEDNKNGEGVYIGTAPEQLDGNPTRQPDTSNHNWVHDNVISVPAECVDVKEAATGNFVEHNTCSGSRDPEGAGFSSRGNGTVFLANVSTGHAGAGIRLGGDDSDDGLGNIVVYNHLGSNEGYGLKVLRYPQAILCGNDLAGNGDGATNAKEGTVGSRCRDLVEDAMPSEGEAAS